MLTPEEAWREIAAELAPLAAETTGAEEALGRRLAEAARATTDVPQADVSAMDGYALAGAPRDPGRVPVVGTAAAGRPAEMRLRPGESAKIMTGAVVPAGADRIVPIELSDGGEQQVAFREITAPGAHIRRHGEVVHRGEPLLGAGTLLTPGALSLLASQGIGRVRVGRAPRVAVLATGDEVVPASAEPGPGQLRDSNTPFLLAAGRSLGLAFETLGIAEDRRSRLRRKVARGIEADVLLLTGGVSMGEFDHAEEVFAELGCRSLFDKVAIQPGKPLVAARHESGWAFGLPGNPASVMVTFWLFVRPLLRALQGFEDAFWAGALRGVLEAPLPPGKGRDRFLPASVAPREGALGVRPHRVAGSHDVSAYARGTALVRIRRDAAAAEVGESCELLPLASWPRGL